MPAHGPARRVRFHSLTGLRVKSAGFDSYLREERNLRFHALYDKVSEFLAIVRAIILPLLKLHEP